ncbi:glycine oxidase ThiO [Roseiarcaceae bacterium H3SJ34-1]|uniref:glycine oxidase ThiO n=1 Tax=Terripilifer ovatus TaxID=3032367 RepID=UPI003AB998FD|nr:glycine oxidase ThiO [Roseiarcaceae bacterium H3SJ34-1]
MALLSDHIIHMGARLPQQPAPSSHPSRLPAQADAIIIGAGVIGLSIGWRLAAAGLSTVVVERDDAGASLSCASLAATGMLAAAAELEAGGEDLLPFALASQRQWPAFRQDLEAASGLSLDYDACSTLVVALTRDETERLRARHDLHRRSGLPSTWLSGPDARAREPGLRPSTTAALFCAEDHQVDPRRLLPALRTAFLAAGGTLVEGCDVRSIENSAGQCSGIVTAAGICKAPIVIVAAGAWAAREGLLPENVRVPVRPLKGQSLALRTSQSAPATSHIVWTEQVHIAPKTDGRLIVGATVEECGFDASITAGGIFALLDGVRRALPSVEDMQVEAVWSGLRPTSEDDAPILGVTPAQGLLLAAGHHRNGILLAPATADAIARLVLGKETMAEAAPLGLSRFGRAT